MSRHQVLGGTVGVSRTGNGVEERFALERIQRDRLERAYRRGAEAVAEQRDLAEPVSGSQTGSIDASHCARHDVRLLVLSPAVLDELVRAVPGVERQIRGDLRERLQQL
jgi:hypothetical protein